MSDNLYLFANNNGGQAEGNGSYRLYDMKIEGTDTQEEGKVNYADYLIYPKGGVVFKTNITYKTDTTVEFELKEDLMEWDGKNNCFEGLNFIIQTCISDGQYVDNDILIQSGNRALENGVITTLTPNEQGVYSYTFTKNINSTRTFSLGCNNTAWTGIRAIKYEKIYQLGKLVAYLRPAFDSKGVPCIYDDVSKTYLYNQGTGTFSCKKMLRDFQPVLDSNNIPCLLDKIKNKFYYNKSGEVFKTKEKVKYRKLDYIQGDGSNYLDLGVWTIDNNTRIELDCDVISQGSSNMIFITGGNSIYSFRHGKNTIFYLQNNNTNKELWISGDTRIKAIITSDEFIHNETSINLLDLGYPSEYSYDNRNLYLFKKLEAGLSFEQNCRIYYFKIYQSDELVLDLIPVLDQDNVPCMYDKVTDTFFYNQGTGTFGYEIEELEGECYEIACTTEDIVNNINPLLPNVKFEVLDNKTISMPESAKWTPFQFDGKSDKGLKLKAYTKYTIIVKPISTYTPHGSICNVCVTDKKRYTLNLDKPTIVETGYKGEFLLYPHISESPVEKIGIIVLEGEHPDAIYSSFDNIQVSIHAEYIESNGTQYIDTGVVPNSNTDIDMTCRACDYSDYVSDGLILNLDGINNTRRGHKSDTTVWEDLSGNGIDFDLHNVTINNDNMYFTGDKTSADVYSYASIQNIEDWVNICNGVENYTVEICIQCGTEGEFYQPIISQKPAKADVAMSVDRFVLNNTTNGLDYPVKFCPNINTLSFNMNTYESFINNEVQDLSTSGSLEIDPPINNNFWIGARLEGSYYCFTGKIYSIRIYNRHLADTERLYNHSVDVKKFGVTTEVQTCNIGKYILNNLSYMNDEYNYNNIDTTVQPNLVASEGATLTMGSTNLALLDDEDIETATNNGWNLV